MSMRMKYWEVAAEEYHALLAIYPKLEYLGWPLVNLIFLRASQINGCAFCVDMHTNEAIKGGEDQRRLNTLTVWRETPFFSERERAALDWCEKLTRLGDIPALSQPYDALRPHFSDKEVAVLTFAISFINSLNRIAVGFGRAPVAE